MMDKLELIHCCVQQNVSLRGRKEKPHNKDICNVYTHIHIVKMCIHNMSSTFITQ